MFKAVGKFTQRLYNGLFRDVIGLQTHVNAKVRVCGFAKIITHSFQHKCKKEEKDTAKHETDGSQTQRSEN